MLSVGRGSDIALLLARYEFVLNNEISLTSLRLFQDSKAISVGERRAARGALHGCMRVNADTLRLALILISTAEQLRE